jgi:XRE family transcriptional regulator, aerobic/anaerobic benzoate catabolism transcriptional regulator
VPTPPPTPAAVGRTIRDLREARGQSRDALAEAAGVSRVYLWGIEAGKRNPSLTLVGQLARALDVSLSELIARAEDTNS